MKIKMTIAKSVLFAPEKIRVGYQSRHNSENGYLSYIVYYDEKNKLRKEVSFNNWIGKEKAPHDVINEEIKGFRIADSVKI